MAKEETPDTMSTKDQNDVKFELELVFRGDATEILAARTEAGIMHHGHDIHAAGDEVEIAFRKLGNFYLSAIFLLPYEAALLNLRPCIYA